MDVYRLREIVAALNRKNVSQPCPRCASKNFSVVGESEIPVTLASTTGGLLSIAAIPMKTTMPIVIISCDNCGFIAHHALAALSPIARGIADL